MKTALDKVIIWCFFVDLFVACAICLVLYHNARLKASYCDTMEEAVSNTNEAVMEYWQSVDQKYTEVIISPVCVQTCLKDYYDGKNQQDTNLFNYFKNGYKSWAESGMRDSSFSLVFFTSEADLHNRLESADYEEGAAYCIMDLKGVLPDAVKAGENLWYSGVGYVGEEGWGFPLEGGYTVWVNAIGGEETEIKAKIAPCLLRSHGQLNGLHSQLDASGLKIQSYFEFEISDGGYESGIVDWTPDYVFDEGCQFFITNAQGVIVAVGKR